MESIATMRASGAGSIKRYLDFEKYRFFVVGVGGSLKGGFLSSSVLPAATFVLSNDKWKSGLARRTHFLMRAMFCFCFVLFTRCCTLKRFYTW